MKLTIQNGSLAVDSGLSMTPDLLPNFMQEFFPFGPLLKAGFFTKEMKGDYEAQAARVCQFFGYKTVYEHGAEEASCHLSKVKPEGPFVTVIPSIYD